MFRYIDKGFLESFGPNGILKFLHYISHIITSLSTEYIPHYAFVMITSIIILLFITI